MKVKSFRKTNLGIIIGLEMSQRQFWEQRNSDEWDLPILWGYNLNCLFQLSYLALFVYVSHQFKHLLRAGSVLCVSYKAWEAAILFLRAGEA